MRKQNVVLIGMPGCGKSTTGVLLATIMGFDFVDTDLLIIKEEGKKLVEIIEEIGNEGFNKVEENLCATLHAIHYNPRCGRFKPVNAIIKQEDIMEKIFVSEDASAELKAYLEQKKFEVVEVHHTGRVEKAVSAHPDMRFTSP